MNKRINQEQFGANASAYADSQTHARGSSLERLISFTRPEKNWLVLDVATGAGHTALAFAPRVAQVWATDITREMLAVTRRLAAEKGSPNIRLGFADAQQLPFAGGLFDLVTCRIAAHHFADIPAFIREARRVLRPGGRLAVVDNIVPEGAAGDYVNAFEKLRDPSHGRCWSLEEWTACIKDHDFGDLQTEILEKTLQFDFWAQRHGRIMKSYLRALLALAPGEAGRFLHPDDHTGGLLFHLQEGIFLTVKSSPEGRV